MTARLAAGDLAQHTDELVVIANWKEELITKINRAHMRGKFAGADHEEQDRLSHEVEALVDEMQSFKKLCLGFLDRGAT